MTAPANLPRGIFYPKMTFAQDGVNHGYFFCDIFPVVPEFSLINTLIVGFHSRDEQPCFSLKTKEHVCIIIKINSLFSQIP